MLFEPTITHPGVAHRYEWVDELELIRTASGELLFHSNKMRYTPQEGDIIKNIGKGKHELYRAKIRIPIHVGSEARSKELQPLRDFIKL